jgi:hypothetical protein
MPGMGHNPIAPRRDLPPRARHRRSLHLHRAREAYALDLLDLDDLERAIEHVLRGGYLDENFVLRAPIMDRVRVRRRQRDCPHVDVYELYTTGHAAAVRKICVDCGASDTT